MTKHQSSRSGNHETEDNSSLKVYHNNLDHILNELERIDLIVRNHVEKWRKHGKNHEFLGLYISEEEVDSILTGKSYELEDLSEAEKLRKEIDKKKEECIQRGVELRLEMLRELFDFTPFETDAVLIAMAPEFDLKYEKLFSYLQNDVTRKKPTVDLILNLTCKSKEQKIDERKHFSHNSTLIRNFILHLEGTGNPLLERDVKLDDRILGFLLGSDEPDSSLIDFVSLKTPHRSFDELTLPEGVKESLSKLNDLGLDSKSLLLLDGSYEVLEVAEAVCSKIGASLLVADLEKIREDSFEVCVKLLFREAELQRAAVYFDKFDMVSEERKRIFLTEIEGFEGTVFLPTRTEPSLKKKMIKIFVPSPSYMSRIELWRSLLGEFERIDELATKFRFGRNKMKAAIESARSRALLRNPANPSLTLDDLYEGCKAQSGSIPFTAKIMPRYTWEDIVLPVDKKEQLREICNYVKHYARVFETWGFEKHTLGKGLNILFSGPSGTGKTMAAEIIAHELRLDMYKIDLSMVVSKYIGETEKNLNRIFKDAEESNAILFFDEADALFGKRSEVKDSHDRYANIEINYLLQKMEEHEGIAILATNLSENIDDAFLRRMSSVVEFPFPDEEYRLAIWKKIFPKQTPLADVNFAFLSRLKISGGNIKNIALTATFLAAENSNCVKMEHIVKAAKREFQKIGKTYGKEEFGKYYELVK